MTSSHRFPLSSIRALIAISVLLICSSTVQAQYFGRNKVQYEDFHFKVLETENFRLYFYPQEQEATRDAGRMAQRWYTRYSQLFNHDLEKGQPIIMYANHADFQQTNVISGLISQGTGGVTEGMRNRVVLPFTGSYAENDHVLGHELVHAFQFSILKKYRNRSVGGTDRMPLWFIEGMSEYLSLGRDYPLTNMWLRDAVLHDDVPDFDKMSSDPKYFPYRWGHAFWAYIATRFGDGVIAPLLKNVAAGGWESAFKNVLKVNVDTLSKDWVAAIKQTYQPEIEGRTAPEKVGTQLLSGGGGMNLAPSISPDGRYVAFLSRRDIFTIDLYLADAETGEVIDKLVSSSTNSHFDALQFMNSAGTWSPDGSQFAFVVFKDGNNQLAIVDVATKNVLRTIKVPHVGAIHGLAWSPDGRQIVISGLDGGISDLFLLNLETEHTERLTNDRHADLQPSWSPDGSTIIFSSDRGRNTNFDELTYSALQIAFYDLSTGQITVQAMADHVKHIDPQYSPDGRNIYFIANPDGFSNIFRYSIDEQKYYRLTNIATGVSGLTEVSPALSVARANGRLAFNVFSKTNYLVNTLAPDETSGMMYAVAGPTITPDDMVFAGAKQTSVQEYLHNPELGLTTGRSFQTVKYNAKLSLAAVGQPSVGVAVGRFGTSLGGGVSLLFSDMLGNRLLGVSAQINGSFANGGGEVFYQNRSDRFNWGAIGGHIPYETAALFAEDTTVTVNGQQYPAQIIQLIRQRVFLERAALMGEYPLSTNQRIELSSGFAHIWYDVESDEILTAGNVVLDDRQRSLDAPSPVNLWQSSAAFVGDYSFFGFTSPVKGRRYRFEAEPSFGTLRYLTVLADYRQYFFLNPFTLAFRGMHYGRYLKDADSDRLSNLFLGHETLVRGYSVGSLDVTDCPNGDCAEVNRLIGTRLGIFNAELRWPLFGTSEFGTVNFAYLPTELVAFFDGGVAWTQHDKPEWEFVRNSEKRVPVFSAGIAARINVLGFLVTQIYWAYPFQRPESNGQFGFVLAPGW